jgi:predicted MPP superfamily phosphohydrolase
MQVIHPGLWRTILGFEFGSFGPLWLREETFYWGVSRPCTLLYASDLHLGHAWTQTVPTQIVAAVKSLRPDVLLLGGDLVDYSSAIDLLQAFISELSNFTTVAGVPGNHDVPALKTAFKAGGGHWLPEEPLGVPIAIDGATNPSAIRADILCAHYPSDFPKAEAAGYRLVLSGHLHGGQCVLAERDNRLYPAWWIHRWHVLRHSTRKSTLLVSRGVGDTLPFRFNCPRELLLCRIE